MSARCPFVPFILVGALAAVGCSTLREKPVTPEVLLPTRFHSEARDVAVVERPATHWWAALGDVRLDVLIDRALAANPDLDIASARIAAARTELRQARASTQPQIELGASTYREQLSGNGLFGAATQAGVFPDLYDSHRVGLDASWEFDLFGADAALRERARQSIAMAEADRDARVLSLSAEVAQIYVEHLAVAQKASAVQRSIDAAQLRVTLLSRRAELGDFADGDVMTARMRLNELKSRLPALEARREALRHAMGMLVGTGEYVVMPEEAAVLENATSLVEFAVPVGVPSDLLRRRPDLRGAEARFREAFAGRQYAIADLYPRFILKGSLGHESLRPGDLSKSASAAWTFARQLSVPLLDGGRRRAERDRQQARLDAAVAEYRSDVIKALVDVEQSLLARRAAHEGLSAQEIRLIESRQTLMLQRARLNLGDCTDSEVAESEQQYQAVLGEVLDARADALTTFIRLQKALGGSA